MDIDPKYIAKAKEFWKSPGYDMGAIKAIATQMQKTDGLIDLIEEYGHCHRNEGFSDRGFEPVYERQYAREAEEILQQIKEKLA